MTAPRVTARKYLGDDAYSWAIFLDGRPVITGLSRAEVSYWKDRIRREARAGNRASPERYQGITPMLLWSEGSHQFGPGACVEDEACWDCTTMGNLQCGPADAPAREGVFGEGLTGALFVLILLLTLAWQELAARR